MSDKSKIEWTDATWNPIRGCSRVSEGCRNCYAERTAARFRGPGQPYEGLVTLAREPGDESKGDPRWTGEVRFISEILDQPMHWKKARRVFVNSMSDLFHEQLKDEWITKIFAVMAMCPQHTFQILTKRPGRMGHYLSKETHLRVLGEAWSILGHYSKYKHGGVMERPYPLPNVWLGVSVEDQETADERIPLLLQTPAAVRWVSYEPALGPVDFTHVQHNGEVEMNALNGDHGVYRPLAGKSDRRLDWIVCGGESGPGARPMHPEWARQVKEQCYAASVPFFFKQWGEWTPDRPEHFHRVSGKRYSSETFAWGKNGQKYNPVNPEPDDFPKMMYRVGKKKAGRLLDGREWNEFPSAKAVSA